MIDNNDWRNSGLINPSTLRVWNSDSSPSPISSASLSLYVKISLNTSNCSILVLLSIFLRICPINGWRGGLENRPKFLKIFKPSNIIWVLITPCILKIGQRSLEKDIIFLFFSKFFDNK